MKINSDLQNSGLAQRGDILSKVSYYQYWVKHSNFKRLIYSMYYKYGNKYKRLHNAALKKFGPHFVRLGPLHLIKITCFFQLYFFLCTATQTKPAQGTRNIARNKSSPFMTRY